MVQAKRSVFAYQPKTQKEEGNGASTEISRRLWIKKKKMAKKSKLLKTYTLQMHTNKKLN